MELDKEKLVDALSQIFTNGTVTVDDFVEWDEDSIEELVEKLIECLQTEEERLDENR